MLINFEQNVEILLKILLNRSFCVCFKLIYTYLNKEEMFRECYNCLKTVIKTHLNDGFVTIFFINVHA